MPETRSLRVFLCHSSEDKLTVRELYRRLIAEGWMDVWLDEEKLYPGQDWNLEIEKAVEAADAILVCLSNNSITKEGYVQRELRIVLDYADYKPEGTLYLIPVRLEDCEPPRRLRRWQYADYFEQDRDSAYRRLIVSLKQRGKGLGISFEKSLEKTVNERKSERLKEKPEQDGTKTGSISVEPVNRSTPGGHAIYTFGEIDFVKVPSGKFLMGSNDQDKNAEKDEKPQHTVILPYDYFIGRFPITNEQYAEYVKAKGAKHPVSGWENKRDHPVSEIPWQDAQKFIEWLNGKYKTNLPDGFRFRLPSEAEWEKAARGEKGLVYPWGDVFDWSRCNTGVGDKGETTPASAYSPQGDSPYGCADMAGNVWEWTRSLWGKVYVRPAFIYPYSFDDGREDESAKDNIRRVLRSGSFFNDTTIVRCAFRWGGQPRIYGVTRGGFRVSASPA